MDSRSQKTCSCADYRADASALSLFAFVFVVVCVCFRLQGFMTCRAKVLASKNLGFDFDYMRSSLAVL